MTYFQKTRWTTAKKQIFNGIKYDSKFEAGYAQELTARKKAGEILGFKTHVKIPLIVNGYTVCDYYIDFIVDYPDGMKEFVETKGYPTEVWKLKWKLFEALMENIPNTRLVVEMQGKYKPPKLRKIK